MIYGHRSTEVTHAHVRMHTFSQTPQEEQSNGSPDSPEFFFFLSCSSAFFNDHESHNPPELQRSQTACDTSLLPLCPALWTSGLEARPRAEGKETGCEMWTWGRRGVDVWSSSMSGTATSSGSFVSWRNNGKHSVVILDVILL